MDGINTALTTGFTTAASSMSETMKAVLPIALGVVGTFLAIKFGVKFFKSLVSK